MDVSVKIEGTNEVMTDLRQFGKEGKKAIKKGVDKTAAKVNKDAKLKLRSDGHIITRRLSSSIHVESKQGEQYNYSDDTNKQYNGSLSEKIDDTEAIVGTNVHYAPYIEFGTKYFSGDSYLEYAAIKNEKTLFENLTDELNKLIQKYSGR